MKIFVFIGLAFIIHLQTQAQCAINPTITNTYVSGTGGNCTYTINLSLTSATNALKFITFVVNGTKYCFRSNGTAFIIDATCGTGPNGVNIGNAPKPPH